MLLFMESVRDFALIRKQLFRDGVTEELIHGPPLTEFPRGICENRKFRIVALPCIPYHKIVCEAPISCDCCILDEGHGEKSENEDRVLTGPVPISSKNSVFKIKLQCSSSEISSQQVATFMPHRSVGNENCFGI